MRNVIRGVSEAAVCCNVFGPKDGVCRSWPLPIVSVADLQNCFSDLQKSVFDDAVGLRVVGQNSDVSAAVLLSEPVDGFYEGLSVVGDDFFKYAPSAEDVFEDEHIEEGTGFSSELSVFGIGGE